MTRTLKSRFRSRPRKARRGVGAACFDSRWILVIVTFFIAACTAYVSSGFLLNGMPGGPSARGKLVRGFGETGRGGFDREPARSLIVDGAGDGGFTPVVGVSPMDEMAGGGKGKKPGNDGDGVVNSDLEGDKVKNEKLKLVREEDPPAEPVKLSKAFFVGNCGFEEKAEALIPGEEPDSGDQASSADLLNPAVDDRRYIFATGFRAPVFHAIKAVNNFFRAANATGRTVVGPFVNHDVSFKFSRVIDATKPAPDDLEEYLKVRHYDFYNSLCRMTAGVEPSMICPDPKDRADVCIGIKCAFDGVSLIESDGTQVELQAFEDLEETLSKNDAIRNAKCLVLHHYQKGVQDPLLKDLAYGPMYNFEEKTGMDKSWWIFDVFRISESMQTLAENYRESAGLVSNQYTAIHLRSETVMKSGCDRACSCQLDSISVAAVKAAQERLDSVGSPMYVAWDITSNTMKVRSSDVEDATSKLEEHLKKENLKLYTNYMDPPTEVFVDIVNLVEAKECVSFGGGAVMAAINFYRLEAGKSACLLSSLYTLSRKGDCKFLLV